MENIDNLNEKNFCLEINHLFPTQEQKQSINNISYINPKKVKTKKM